MEFKNIDLDTQDKILELLNAHIAVVADILKSDHELLPMLMLPDTKQMIGLQPKNGESDENKAYALVINKLKNEPFSFALFSYSTKIGLENERVTDAIRTTIFTTNGMEITFFTPYSIKGLFKKTVDFNQTIFGEIKENIFD